MGSGFLELLRLTGNLMKLLENQNRIIEDGNARMTEHTSRLEALLTSQSITSGRSSGDFRSVIRHHPNAGADGKSDLEPDELETIQEMKEQVNEWKQVMAVELVVVSNYWYRDRDRAYLVSMKVTLYLAIATTLSVPIIQNFFTPLLGDNIDSSTSARNSVPALSVQLVYVAYYMSLAFGVSVVLSPRNETDT